MAATYDLTTSVGKVRLIIGDTDTDNAVFSDAELTYFLSVNSGNVNLAAASACEAWVAKYAAAPMSEKIGDYSYSQQAVANFNKLAVELRAKEASTPAIGWAEFDFNATLGTTEAEE